MSKKFVAITCIIAMALFAALALQNTLLAQRPGGGPGGGAGGPGGFGGFRGMMGGAGIQDSWAYVSFELSITDDQLSKARKVYQGSWENMNKLREEARSSGSFEGLREKFEKLNSDLKANLKTVLTADQLKKLTDWETARQQQMQGRPGGGGQ
jgi:Spy/CpxP family protein refolding chaperone